jgi:hypothetical protein
MSSYIVTILIAFRGPDPHAVATALADRWVHHRYLVGCLLLEQLMETRQYSGADTAIALLRMAFSIVYQSRFARHKFLFIGILTITASTCGVHIPFFA